MSIYRMNALMIVHLQGEIVDVHSAVQCYSFSHSWLYQLLGQLQGRWHV